MFFRGRSSRILDPKGRVMLSPEFRSVIAARSEGSILMLTTYDGCVVAFPLPEWEIFEEKINRITNPSRTIRDFRRLVLGGVEEVVPDAQGRIRLSRDHMQYAGISKDAVLVGQGARFELWSPEGLAPVLSQNLDDVAQDLAESGIDFGF